MKFCLHAAIAFAVLKEGVGPGGLRLKALWGPALLMGFENEQTVGVTTTNDSLCLLHTTFTPIPSLLPRCRNPAAGLQMTPLIHARLDIPVVPFILDGASHCLLSLIVRRPFCAAVRTRTGSSLGPRFTFVHQDEPDHHRGPGCGDVHPRCGSSGVAPFPEVAGAARQTVIVIALEGAVKFTAWHLKQPYETFGVFGVSSSFPDSGDSTHVKSWI